MTSIEVQACCSIWGSLLSSYPQSSPYITCNYPGRTVLPLTSYRWEASARNACMDLHVGKQSCCETFEKFYQDRTFLEKIVLQIVFRSKYSCIKNWITIVLYVIKQLTLNLKVYIFRVLHVKKFIIVSV